MKIIGLTGGMATGKSTVTKMLQDESMKVVDADLLAREVVLPGSFGLRSLREIFGPGIIQGEELNRTLLRQKIFEDPGARKVVENILHPLIQWRARSEFKALSKLGCQVVFYDAALIFEKNMMNKFDAVVVVHTNPEVQLSRLMERDKLSRERAERILSSQWPIAEKKAASHFSIDNNGTWEETARQVKELVQRLVPSEQG